MNAPRKPAAFRVDEDDRAQKRKSASKTAQKRKARAIDVEKDITIAISEDDPFGQALTPIEEPRSEMPKRRGARLGLWFAGAVGLLVSLAVGLWVDNLLVDLFSRAEWLGWLASGLAAVAGLTLLAILVREISSLFRLRSVSKLRDQARNLSSQNDIRVARRLVSDLTDFTRTNPATARGREALGSLENEIIDAADLIAIAEKELFSHLDLQAKQMVLQSAKRVSVVTAVSPRALIDIGYVLFESARLVRRLSELYGGRPGTLGFFKLIRDVASHLAVTGSIAVGDSLVQQLVGHGLAAKLSARLGEGVVNGLMTVRIGIAAMETVRPLPFKAVKRPGMSDFLSALAGSSPVTGQDNKASDA